jgi:uncharacterized membrane protein
MREPKWKDNSVQSRVAAYFSNFDFNGTIYETPLKGGLKDLVMSTTKQEYSRHVSVPSDEGVRVDKAITIEKPVSEVYSFWRRFENLPRFMRHVESVTVQDDLHSHWVVKAFGAKKLEWDSEIIEQRDNEMISWRSLPGADVDNAGSVWFTPVPSGNGTVVRLEMKYIPPGGKTGAMISKLFRQDAGSEIDEDLNRLKTLLETGQLPEEENDGMAQWRERTVEFTRKAAGTANEYVHENPWVIVAGMAIIGFTVGLLLGRRRDRLSRLTEALMPD